MAANAKEPENKEARSGSTAGLVIVSLCVLVVGMVASIYYPSPSGQALGFWAFVGLWLRELLFVGVAVVVIVVLAYKQAARKQRTHEQDAP